MDLPFLQHTYLSGSIFISRGSGPFCVGAKMKWIPCSQNGAVIMILP